MREKQQDSDTEAFGLTITCYLITEWATDYTEFCVELSNMKFSNHFLQGMSLPC